MLNKAKFLIAEKIKQNPYLWAIFWNTLPRLPFLLPHDKSYLGIRHVLANSTGLILDVGANNGISAAGFRRLDDTHPILSIEANRHHERALKRLRNTLTDFDYRILGAGENKGSLTLHTPLFHGIPIHTHVSTSLEYMQTSLNRDFSQRVMRQIQFDEQSVEIVPLDDLDLEPCFVKMDIEGADGLAMRGLRNTTQRCRPTFLVEYTPGEMDDVFEFLREHEYSMLIYDENGDYFYPFDEEREAEQWATCNLQVNLYCIGSEKLAQFDLPTKPGL